MKLTAKVLPEYFGNLDLKFVEFRQIEDITLENSETGERRTFEVKDIRRLVKSDASNVKKIYPNVPWDPDLPVYAIELGDELDRNDIVSVPPEISAGPGQGDRMQVCGICHCHPCRCDIEKPWYAVMD